MGCDSNDSLVVRSGIILVRLVCRVLLGLPRASVPAVMRVEGISPRLAIVCLWVEREVSDLRWLLVVVRFLLLVPPSHPCVSLWEGGCFPHMLLVTKVPHQSPLSVVLGTADIYRGAPIESRTAYVGCLLLLGWGQEMPCQGSFFCGVGDIRCLLLYCSSSPGLPNQFTFLYHLSQCSLSCFLLYRCA